MEKKKKLIILGIITLTLVIIGTTYAILTWTSTKINLGLNSGCFTIDYTKGQDISGNLKLLNGAELSDGNGNFVIKEGMGLSYANLGIKSSCTIEGYGSLYLNVTTLSDSFKEGGDSNGALGYALLRNTSNLSNDKLTIENLKGQSFEIIDAKPITNTGTIKLVTEQLSNTELNKYLIVIFVISQAAGNSITSATFTGNISADAEQGKYVEPTPEYCFNITDKDETNKTATISNYNCYSGNSEGYETITDVVIPNTIDGYKITKIYGTSYRGNVTSAFKGKNLTSVVIPDSVKELGSGVFQDNKLTTAVILSDITSVPEYAFENNQLTSIIIPNSVETIGYAAFRNNLLKNVELGNLVTLINSYAFSNNQLTNIIIPDSVITIELGAFSNNQLTNIIIPDSVSTIEGGAFSNNQLTDIALGSSATAVNFNAFDFNPLLNISVSQNNSMYDSRDNCNAIIETSSNTLVLGGKKTVIPDSVTKIGVGAFYGRQNITDIMIPDSITEIGDEAFQNCNLSYVLINAGSNLTSIGSSAFLSSNLTINLSGITYVNNPNLKIYNNSGKAFDWNKAVNGTSGTTFVTGTTNVKTNHDITYNAVTVTTGQPS